MHQTHSYFCHFSSYKSTSYTHTVWPVNQSHFSNSRDVHRLLRSIKLTFNSRKMYAINSWATLKWYSLNFGMDWRFTKASIQSISLHCRVSIHYGQRLIMVIKLLTITQRLVWISSSIFFRISSCWMRMKKKRRCAHSSKYFEKQY